MSRTASLSMLSSAASRNVLVAAIVLQIFTTTLPAYAETVLQASQAPIQAASGTIKTEPGQILPAKPAQPDRITVGYVTDYFTDTGRILSSPPKWDGTDWLKAGLVIGVTSGLLAADAYIRDLAQRNQSQVGDRAAALGNALGNPLYTLPPLGLFYLYGHFNDDPKARRASLLAVESLAISGVFNGTVKLTVQRARPHSGETPTTWNGPSLKTSNTSFPSFHTTTAFSIATVFAEEYESNPIVPPVAYGLATLTALVRIYDNKHWASDVFFGAAIGYFVGKSVIKYHSVQSDSAIRILPTVSQQGFGMTAEYRF